MKQPRDILYFTIAAGGYTMYAAPYAAAALITDPDAKVEILVAPWRLAVASPSMSRARAIFGLDRLNIRPVPDAYAGWARVPRGKRICGYGGRHPYGSIRWLEHPEFEASWVYICDCDLLCTHPSWVARHLLISRKLNLPYSNIVRPPLPDGGGDQRRMSGCHFARHAVWYGSGTDRIRAEHRRRITAGDLNYYDERLLLRLAEQIAGLPHRRFTGKYTLRPLPGLHLSSTRDPRDRLGWNVTPGTVAEYRRLTADPRWREIAAVFDPEFVALQRRLQEVIDAEY